MHMDSIIAPVIIGLAVIFLGIQNMKGNITTLHRYHRKRVSEEDRIPFGRKVGLGSIFVGCSVILKAVFQFVAEKLNILLLDTLGTVILVVGLVAGFGIIIYSMIKYNKGLF